MSIVLVILIQCLLAIFLVILIAYYIRLHNTLAKEKRIARFCVDPNGKVRLSFLDKLFMKYDSLIERISRVLKSTKVFDTYALKYEVYVDNTVRIRKDPMDFISNKILISLFAVVILIISVVLKWQHLSFLQVILVMLLGFFIPDVFLYFENKRREKQIENDLLKAIIIMNNAFKSGRSIMQAIELVAKELDGPISDEFRKMFIDLTYGLELELVFERFSKRVKLEEVKYMASSLVILNKTGGNIVQVFSSIEKGFFDRKKLKDEMKSVTALSNFVFKILVFIPVLIFVMVYIVNPTYFVPLFTTNIGKVLLLIVLVIYFTYIFIVSRLTRKSEW